MQCHMRTMQKCVLPKNGALPVTQGHARPALRSTAAPHVNRQVQASSVTEQAVTAQAAAEVVKTGQIIELNKDTFYPFLEEAQDTLVVVDFYTDWCGPCKVIYPELVKMSSEYEGRVLFSKVNCNKSNKELGVKLQIKVAPTFHLYKRSQKVADMTGAKVDKLRALIEQSL